MALRHQEVILQAKGINKVYYQGNAKIEALKGIDLDIYDGEVVAIFGPSGAGKSSLLHILGGLDRPTRGEVFFQGCNITDLGDDELAGFRNSQVGFVFQFHHLLPEFTALENVMMPMLIGHSFDTLDRHSNCRHEGKNWKERVREDALKILTEMGLRDRINHRPSELSAGEQQRVAVARAIANSPKIILADEPTGDLDKSTGELVFKILLTLNEEKGKTLVIVTHNDELVSKVSSLPSGRIVQLRYGSIVNNL